MNTNLRLWKNQGCPSLVPLPSQDKKVTSKAIKSITSSDPFFSHFKALLDSKPLL